MTSIPQTSSVVRRCCLIAASVVVVHCTTALAIASPFSLELSTGVAVPYNENYRPHEQVLGLQFTAGARLPLFEPVDGLFTFDYSHTWTHHESQEPGSSGGNRTVLQGAVNAGTSFINKPNVYVGIGYYRASWSDFSGWDWYGSWREYRPKSQTGAIVQIALHFDIAQTSAGDVFITGRFVRGLYMRLDDEIAYIPITVGFRFK